MRRMTLCAVGIALLVSLGSEAETTDPMKVKAELERMTNELLDAIAPGDTGAWKRYTHERLIYVSEANEVMTKAQLLEELKPLPKGLIGNLEVGDFKAEVHGNVAVTTYVAKERLDYFGQVIESQFRTTDAWLKTAEGWRMISTQVLAVLEDPPAIQLSHDELCSYSGLYRLTPEITTKVSCTDDGLSSERTGRKAATMKAEVRDVFFNRDNRERAASFCATTTV